MQPLTKDNLHQLTDDSLKKIDDEIINNIVSVVHHNVIHTAENGEGTRVSWSVKTGYFFGGLSRIRDLHLVKARVRLQYLFPDSIVTRSEDADIIVDWT